MAEKIQEEEDPYVNMNDFQDAINDLETYLKISREVGDRAYHRLGDLQKTIGYYERYLKTSKEVADEAGKGKAYGKGKVYGYLGTAYGSLGDFQIAKEYHKRDFDISKEVGNRAGKGRGYCNLIIDYHSLGDVKKAIQYHEGFLKISKKAGDKVGEGAAYGNLGIAYHSLGDFQKAIQYHQRHLKISTEVGDRAREGGAYCNLGNAYHCLGDFQEALKYHERHLKISIEAGDKVEEGVAYGNLGNAFESLGDLQKAIEYHERHLKITKEVGDRAEEGRVYCNLGNAYHSLGDVQKAKEYHERHLKISKEVGNRAGEGRAYCHLGCIYHSLGDFQKAIEYHKRHLQISKEVGHKLGEGVAYGNLGNTYNSLGDFPKAIEYHERHLKISKEVGDKVGEGRAYGNLGNAFYFLRDFQKAIEYHERLLKISKEVGDRVGEGIAYISLGNAHKCLGNFHKAIQYHTNSVSMFDHIRGKLLANDEWKISLRSMYDLTYSSLWGLQFMQGKVVEALLTADHGRAQALNDLLEFKYGLKELLPDIGTLSVTTSDILSYLPSITAFIGINKGGIVLWVNEKGKEIKTRKTEINISVERYFESLLESTCEEIGVRADVNCEDRSLGNPSDKKLAEERSPRKPRSHSSCFETESLQTLYNVVIDPIRDLLHGDEVVIVPEGPLCLTPYAAFMDLKSKYLCETFRIRLLPSISTLRLIQNCPADWHSKTGALLVGDPWVQEVVYEGMTLEQLEWAEKEVQMIGEILQAEPVIGKQATKDEVLKRISSVALVHIAAHGSMETGEIALAPNSTRSSQIPDKEDYLLTMKDVLNAQIRARLVVLSCCHSARGEVKAEGVVGIARAFLGAGARSVLVSLWAIDDEATMKFMEFFYQQLVNGRSASEALNKAMKSMRESDRFSAVKYWAPFVLIGDDVTLEFEDIK